MYSKASQGRMYKGKYGPRLSKVGKMLIVLKLLDWIHDYASIAALAAQVERLILGEKIGKDVVEAFPYTFLRIANLIQGEELFRTALAC